MSEKLSILEALDADEREIVDLIDYKDVDDNREECSDK